MDFRKIKNEIMLKSFEKFLENDSLRLGQCVYIVAQSKFFSEVCSILTEDDCFYDDNKIDLFFKKLENKISENKVSDIKNFYEAVLYKIAYNDLYERGLFLPMDDFDERVKKEVLYYKTSFLEE